MEASLTVGPAAMGICGSCGMMINGKPVLTCATYLESALPGPVRVEPLRGFPVIRDLVGDMTDFVEKLKSVKPWIVRDDEKPLEEGEYRQTPEQLAEYKQYSMCINCMLLLCGLPHLRAGATLHRSSGHRPRPTV